MCQIEVRGRAALPVSHVTERKCVRLTSMFSDAGLPVGPQSTHIWCQHGQSNVETLGLNTYNARVSPALRPG